MPTRKLLDFCTMTLVGCGLILLLCIFEATTKTNYTITTHLMVASCVAAVIGILFHIARIFIRSLSPVARVKHLSLAVLCGLISGWAVPNAVEHHFAVLRGTFFERLPYYEGIVSNVKSNQSVLTDKYTRVSGWVGRESVFARTNEDGSLSVRFYGRVDGGRLDSMRVGYEYDNGPRIPHPKHTNHFTKPQYRAYDFLLTNAWYEVTF